MYSLANFNSMFIKVHPAASGLIHIAFNSYFFSLLISLTILNNLEPSTFVVSAAVFSC